MIAWFTSLQFLTLSAGAIAAAVPLLVLAYRHQDQMKRRVVSSLLLLRLLPQRRLSRSKLKFPLRFFLELLALLLLSFAALSPFTKEEGKRVAVVFDNSLSMSAKLADNSGRTRFDAGKAALFAWLAEQPGDFSYSLHTPTPGNAPASDLSSSGLRSAVEALIPSPFADSLSVSLNSLRSSGKFDRFVLVSDKRLAEEAADVTLLRTDALNSNVYLAGLRLEKAPAEKSQRLTVILGLSGLQPMSVAIEVFSAPGYDREATKIATLGAQALPDRLVEISTDVPAPARGAAYLEVRLRPEGNAGQDAVAEDNVGYAVMGAAPSRKLLLVSDTPGNKGLERIGSFQVQAVSADALPPAADLEREYQLLVYYQTAPTQAARVPTLVVLPPAGNALFPVLGTEQNVEVTSWRSEHPLTSYLNVPLLKPARAALLRELPWTQSVIRGARGALVLSGESAGVRFVATGLELLPYEAGKTPVESILMLNIVNWLLGGEELGLSLLTGARQTIPGQTTAVIRRPSGEIEKVDNQTASASSFLFDKPGFFHITLLGGTAASPTRSSQIFAVNAFHPDESATAEEHVVELASARPDEPAAVGSHSEPIWPLALAGVLLLLALEYLLLNSRRVRAANSGRSHA